MLDGIPRTLAQAERAYALAKPAGWLADAVIYLEVPDDVARDRLATTRSDRPRRRRGPNVVDRRLQIFHADTAPLLNFYRERGILMTIDAVQSVDAVSDAIFRACVVPSFVSDGLSASRRGLLPADRGPLSGILIHVQSAPSLAPRWLSSTAGVAGRKQP